MTDTSAVREQDYGVLERGNGAVTLRFTRQLPHSPQKVWRALTEAEHLAAWFPTTVEGAMTVGAALKFSFRDVPMPPMEGRLLVCDPPAVLEFSWGDERLRFELTAAGSGTVLDFSATFAEIGKAARDGAGWHVCLDQLGYAMAERPAPFGPDDRWRLVHPAYVARFGPEASTVGPPQEWEDTYGPV
jgi:uncharacterized protein YndB with AHSA1/START domain